LKADNGTLWDKAYLKTRIIDPWLPLVRMGVPVHVGEFGCYNKTPHDAVLGWMKDALSLWKEAGWGYASGICVAKSAFSTASEPTCNTRTIRATSSTVKC